MDTARWLEAGESQSILRFGGRRGLGLLLGLALFAAWTGHTAAVFLIAALLALWLLGRWWADRAVEGLAGHHELLEDRGFPGDSLRVRIHAANRGRLPLAWLRVRSAIPAALTPVHEPRRWPGADRGGYLQGLTALGWHSQAVWEFEVPCRARGVHQIGPLELMSGDPFGFFTRRLLVPERVSALVYPKIVPLRQLGLPLAAELGFARRRQALQEDPSRQASVRDYRAGDPPRRIHWRATAHQGQLQVRVFEPTAAPEVVLVLACDSFDFPWTRYREDLFELAVSALASIAWRAREDGWQVGLITNHPDVRPLAPASNPAQLTQILERLARVKPDSRISLADLVAAQQRGSRTAAYVLALGQGCPGVELALDRLRASRRPVVLLYGDEPPAGAGRLPAYRLRHWDDLATTLEGPGGRTVAS